MHSRTSFYPEYDLAKTILSSRKTHRTGISHFVHVEEGLIILNNLTDDADTKGAFCLHPLIQKTSDFIDNYICLKDCSPISVALAVEYRWIANQGTRYYLETNPGAKIILSEFLEINHMLIADKIQNRKDFLATFNRNDSEFDALDQYFKNWMEALKISEPEYGIHVELIDKRTIRNSHRRRG